MTKKSMTTKTSDRRGFTLAELLVVVAIIAILVAVSIVIFTGKQKEAKETVCKANRESLKHHIVADYLSGDLETLNDEVLKTYIEMDKEGDKEMCPSGGTYYIQFTENTKTFEGGFSIRCTYHDDGKNSDVASGFSGAGFLKALTEIDNNGVIKEYFKTHLTIDSGATDSERSKTVERILKENDIDLEKEGVKTWAYRYYKQGDNKYNKMLYWSSVDIQQKNPGEEVPFIRYNVQTKTYTVWNVSVKKGEGTQYKEYRAIDSEKGSTLGPEVGKQTYENAKKVYEDALKKYNKQK